MKRLAPLLLIAAECSTLALGQTSKIVPFQQASKDGSTSVAYQPMPIIFLHGIMAGRDTWNLGLQNLPTLLGMSSYAWQIDPVQAYFGTINPGQNIQYQPTYPLDSAYLHTFDYGFYGRTDVGPYGHRQTLDDIASNAWFGVAHNPDNTSGQSVTLLARINTVRQAYRRIDGTLPPVILVGHSMGGVVSHFYLSQIDPNAGTVARLITLGTPHYGSYLPNLAMAIRSDQPGWCRIVAERALNKIFQTAGWTLASDLDSAVKWAYPTPGNPEKTGMQNMSITDSGNYNALIAYFAALGFKRIERSEAPAQIQATTQFRSLCPKSAVCMACDISAEVIHASTELLRLRPDVPGARMWAVSLQHTMLTYFEVEPRSHFEAHSHESEQITMVLSGELFFEVQGVVHCIKPGEVIAIPSSVPHAVWTEALAVTAIDAWSPVMRKYESTQA
jgi:pimeloyl-ACP methyl ester carboxylesterase